MSATAAKNKKNNQPALVTTGQGAAFCVTLGISLMALGLLWILSMLVPAGSSEILRQMALTLYGLCGPLCPFFPVLLIWAGTKLMVSTRHRVAVRDVLIVAVLYWLLLAGYTLFARMLQGTSNPSYLDYVGRVSFQGIPADHNTFSDYLYLSYRLDTKTGGLLGMLLAYPMWKLLTRIGALLFVACAMIALFFLLFRLNPGDLFRSASDRSERMRQKREQKRQEKEWAAQQQAQQNAQQEAAPAVQELPMEPLQPQQFVQREETVYPTPAYYSPAPVYNAVPQPAAAQPAPSDGFYPVQPDLYDERFALHPNVPVEETTPSVPVQTPVQTSVSQPEQKQEETVPSRFRRRRYHPSEEKQEVQAAPNVPAAKPEPVQKTQTVLPPQPAVPQPAMETRPAETRPAETPPVQNKAKPSVPSRPAVRIPEPAVPDVQDETDDELPWDVPVQPVRGKTPAPAIREEQKKVTDWQQQLSRRQAEVNNSGSMPAHTTAARDPKPVGVEPAVPLTGERIPITSKKELDTSSLDGTGKPSSATQGSMALNIPYEAPPIRLLKESRHVPQENAAQEDEQKAQIIENTLRSFGVESEVKQIMHGPAITRFAIQIAPGVKVSRVSNTADNLALELKSKHVRVEAPIQGTSYIGIEVPNQLVSTVSLREVLDSPEMHNNPSPLLVALGKDIAGAPILCDLSKMPHLLIAGATGSGKSVCINSIVCSLLYRTSPDQVRLIMIDPKQVELSVYNAIPHLLVPVVSDPRKAAGALSWVVQEMLERYGKFSAQGVRNLAGYNKANQGTDQVLPNIVVIIDEMADLMEVCRKDVEESIRRLAALARAAGIYMVLATQRPSVDVITGVIKNNIPSRIAFAVSSGTDSRTIIDINGAEKLMGKGDMLYKPAGTSPTRVQGCFVSDEEVNAIADYIGSRYQTNYDVNIVEHLDNAGKEHEADETTGFDDGNGSVPAGGSGANEGEFSDLLQQAIEMAVEDGQTSTSMLQRRLRVGYARAGRLIDEMEKRGIISQSEGSKPRKTLLTREQYYELLQNE